MMAFRTAYEWQYGSLREIPFEDLRPGMIAVMEETTGVMTPFFLVLSSPQPDDLLVYGNAKVEGKTITI